MKRSPTLKRRLLKRKLVEILCNIGARKNFSGFYFKEAEVKIPCRKAHKD